MNKTRLRIYLALMTAVCVAGPIFIGMHQWWGLALCILVFLYILSAIIKLYNTQIHKIQVLFDAVENNDYSFRFPEKGVKGTELEMNRSFNEMRKLLAKAKFETIEREKYYELILNRVTTGVIVMDQNGFVRQTNDAALNLLGLPVLTHISQLERVRTDIPQLLRNSLPDQNRQIHIVTERGERNLLINISELSSKETKLRIIALNDIATELDENEIESWIRLTRVLTHEIMNGISPITSMSELLLKKNFKDQKIREGLEVIHHTGKQLSTFVSSYRQFTRIPEPHPEIFDIKEFLSLQIAGMRSTTTLPISFRLEVEPEDLLLYADRTLIGQIIRNLLKNAIHALENTAEPYILLRASNNEKDQIVIMVDNNGEQIDEEVAKQIFIPFFTTRENGSGIGLSVSKQIMRQHNGTLKLSYSTPQQTRFMLLFR